MIEGLVISIGGILLVGFTVAICYKIFQRRYEKLLNSIEQMIEAGRRGEFRESLYNESKLSATENKMARYVADCTLSAGELGAEKDKIKTLIADISHQTKTPLANVLLYAQLIDESVTNEQDRTCTKALVENAEKLSFLITALVKTSRLETGIIKVCPCKGKLHVLVEKVLGQIGPKAEHKKISFKVKNLEAEEAVFDLKWTIEALYNICDNAVKYSPKGSKIEISVKAYELFAAIEVKDYGIGIREEEHSKVFQRFYRSYDVAGDEGVGIGLFLAREIINSENGYIKLDSKLGEGSTFKVFLPR